jgi:hypothetical protein
LETISVIACIASPELLPNAGSPQIFNDGKLLNRSRSGDPWNQWPAPKEEKGVMAPP